MITKFDESVVREMCRVLGIDFDDPATSVCGISMTGKRLRIEIEDHSTHPWVTRVHKLYYNWSPEKPKGRLVFVPEGHAFYTFPVPAISDSTDDDGSAILDSIAGPLRGAAAHVQEYLDNGEDG